MRYIVAVFLLLVCGCGRKSGSLDNIRLIDFPEYAVELTADFSGPELTMTPASQAELLGNNLLLMRPGGAAAIQVNLNTGESSGPVWMLGRGPNEFIAPYFAGTYDGRLWVYDITKANVSEFSLDIPANGTISTTHIEELKYTGDIALFSMHRLHNGLSVSRVISGPGNVLRLLDKNLNVIDDFCNPLPGVEVGNLGEFQGMMSSSGNTFVYATMGMGYIGCFDISDQGEITPKWEYYLDKPSYKTTPQFEIDQESKEGVYDVSVTDSYVFALYSGKTRKQGPIPSTLLVFDHEGEPVKRINLDCECGRFCVGNDLKLYTLSHPDQRMTVYDLSEQLP